jgi:acyl-CoA thioester hydrolase
MTTSDQPKSTRPRLPNFADYPWRAENILRYNDADGQGHVNNAVFSTFFESARLSFLHDPASPLYAVGAEYVLARIEIDFLGEMRWPGRVTTGIRIIKLGRSSVVFDEALFVNGVCVGRAQATAVLIDSKTRRSRPFPHDLAERFRAAMSTVGVGS